MSDRGASPIFVALASSCEPELALTIDDCLRRAERPDRLRFGVLHQFDEDGPPRSARHAWPTSPTTIVSASSPVIAARAGADAGPVTGSQGLYEGEEYTLQVDAHSRFADGWDDRLVEMMEELPSDRPLITGDDEGWIAHPTEHVDHARPAPRRNRVLSGAFVFAPGSWITDVRQDPAHVYTGEEFALATRRTNSPWTTAGPARTVNEVLRFVTTGLTDQASPNFSSFSSFSAGSSVHE